MKWVVWPGTRSAITDRNPTLYVAYVCMYVLYEYHVAHTHIQRGHYGMESVNDENELLHSSESVVS